MAKVEEIDQNDFIESIRLERNEGFRTNHKYASFSEFGFKQPVYYTRLMLYFTYYSQTREGAQQVKGLTKKVFTQEWQTLRKR